MTVVAGRTGAHDQDLAPPGVREGSGKSLGYWGTWAMIITEAVLFALLLFAYFQLRVGAEKWPLGDIADPELVKSGFRTVVLLGSTIPMHLADKAAEARNQTKLRWSLGVGWLMGAIFLAGHFDEWATLLREFTPTTNAYGSLLYTITGLHALHLIIGLVVAGYLWVGAVAGRYEHGSTTGVKCGILYWHFVDAVWVVVYSTLYLSVSLP